MARKKVWVAFSGYGSASNGYVYFEEDEERLLRENQAFLISLVEKYNPSYAGKVTSANISGYVEEA